jgi:hypothetical protein
MLLYIISNSILITYSCTADRGNWGNSIIINYTSMNRILTESLRFQRTASSPVSKPSVYKYNSMGMVYVSVHVQTKRQQVAN